MKSVTQLHGPLRMNQMFFIASSPAQGFNLAIALNENNYLQM